MIKKYSIHNQLTGLQEEALTFEDAKTLQQRIKQEWLEYNAGLFTLTVLVQNEDGSLTQSVADADGNPVQNTIIE